MKNSIITFEKDYVNYQIEDNEGEIIEITGRLESIDTGRGLSYSFIPDQFIDPIAELYWDANWESIEEEIIKALDSY